MLSFNQFTGNQFCVGDAFMGDRTPQQEAIQLIDSTTPIEPMGRYVTSTSAHWL
jgi:hypothetical protein